ncbi:hypothetical protein SNE40_022431 [Patella caerulea]|uniref:Uncharacterized protein n=1 Tax=Patella caerulea TaxID=87958 RepID=A0AAN8J3X4_PATCE
MASMSESEEDILFEIPEAEQLLLKDSIGIENMEIEKEKSSGCCKNVCGQRRKFPVCIYYILGNEFCERFSYYGLKTILVIYLTRWLMFSSDHATIIYHVFTMLCYFSPILGAIIADGYLGRFRTIMYLSILYAIGNTVLSLTALPPPEAYGPMIGLILIGIGTGGIKPCVAAMGGDQFTSDQERERRTFFSVFYFMINLGSMLSTIISPILRADVHCIGKSCYPLAFGVPALLMFVAILIFFAGRKQYKMVPLTGNVIGQVCKCIWHAIARKCTRSKTEKKKNHWLDHAEDKYEPEFIDNVKRVMKVLWLFLPLPVFWALFDQQGSRWTLQAEQMDGHVGSWGRIKPDQLQVLNPILILVLIPIFEHIVYPLLEYCKIPARPLQKMVVGMMFGGLAFVIAGFVQIKLDTYKESHLSIGESGVTFINTVDCPISISSSIYSKILQPNQISKLIRFKENNISISGKCETTGYSTVFNATYKDGISYQLVLMTTEQEIFKIKKFEDMRSKPKAGRASISIINNLAVPSDNNYIQLIRTDDEDQHIRFNITQFNTTDFNPVEPGSYTISIPGTTTPRYFLPEEYKLGTGAVYTLLLYTSNNIQEYDPSQVKELLHTSVDVNQVSMFYMIPQYIVITVGEVLFSVTGLSFAYNEAPQSMKSVVQAGWLTTTAVGNLIVVFVAEISLIPSQTAEFFLFAALMGLDIILFAIMTCFYKYSGPLTPYSSPEASSDTDILVNNEVKEDIPLQDTNGIKSKYS